MDVRQDLPCETTCREIVEVVSDHLERALPHTEMEAMEQHVSRCPECTAYLAQLRLMLRLVSHGPS